MLDSLDIILAELDHLGDQNDFQLIRTRFAILLILCF